MTSEDLVETERRLRELWRTDPARAVQEAGHALTGARDVDSKALFAGILVDAGFATREERSIRRGIATIKQLVHGPQSRGGYRYMEGTAYLALADLQPIRTVAGYEATKKVRVRARRALWEAATSTDTANLTRAQAWVNLGNDLREAGRWDEAYGCYRSAMRQDRDHPVAAGYAASILLTAHSAWSTHGAGWEPVAHHLARIAQAGHEKVAVTADGAEKMFERFPTDRADEASFPEVSEYSAYEQFVYRHRLYLAIAPDGEFHPDSWDDPTTPALIEPLDTGPLPPAFIAMFNLCKADYLVARHLGWAKPEARTPAMDTSTRTPSITRAMAPVWRRPFLRHEPHSMCSIE